LLVGGEQFGEKGTGAHLLSTSPIATLDVSDYFLSENGGQTEIMSYCPGTGRKRASISLNLKHVRKNGRNHPSKVKRVSHP